MGRLLKFEFRKLFHSKLIYIFLGITVITVLFEGLLYFGLDALFGNIEGLDDLGTSIPLGYYFPKSVIGGTFLTIIAIYVSIFAVEENMQGTAKNIVGKGYSRLKLYFSKYLISLLITVIFAIIAVLIGIALGLLAWGPESFNNDDNLLIIALGQLLSLISFHALYFMIAYIVGKMAGGIIINILIASLLGSILMIIDMALEPQGVKVSQYWISGIMTNFTGTTNPDLYVSNFVLLFVYLGLFEGLGIFFASRKQY